MENFKLRTKLRMCEQEWTLQEKLVSQRIQGVYFNITMRTRAAFSSRLKAMESTIGMLKSRKHELKEDNTRLRHELMDKEKSLNNMHVQFARLLIWLKRRRETNARLIVRLQRDMVNVCKHKFYKIGGKIRTVRHIALRGQRI